MREFLDLKFLEEILKQFTLCNEVLRIIVSLFILPLRVKVRLMDIPNLPQIIFVLRVACRK